MYGKVDATRSAMFNEVGAIKDQANITALNLAIKRRRASRKQRFITTRFERSSGRHAAAKQHALKCTDTSRGRTRATHEAMVE